MSPKHPWQLHTAIFYINIKSTPDTLKSIYEAVRSLKPIFMYPVSINT